MPHTMLSRRAGRCLALAFAAMPLLGFAGCAAIMANLIKATATEQRAFSVSTQPSVIVDTFNGSITVKANPENKVEAIVTKVGSGANLEAAEADLKNVSVDYTQEGGTVRITARRVGPKPFGSSGASIALKVPAQTVLSLTTRNGEISTEAIQGDLVAQSSNGGLSVQGGKGKLDLKTSNGTIKVDAAQANLTAETSNGDVRFVGTLAGGSHSLATSNGSVELKLPAESPVPVRVQDVERQGLEPVPRDAGDERQDRRQPAGRAGRVGIHAPGDHREAGDEQRRHHDRAHPVGRGAPGREAAGPSRSSSGDARLARPGRTERLDHGRVGRGQLAAAQQAEQAGRVVGLDDGDLVDVQLGHPPQGGVQVVLGRDREHRAGGQVVGQDQRPPVRADQGQPEVAEREDPGEPALAVDDREERLGRPGHPVDQLA